MIDVAALCKHYGETIAVDNLTFTVRPGVVTGFLGPNGAGKSTTMRMILGLDRPTSGTATVNGRALQFHRSPLAEIGFLLDAGALHPRRSSRNHLLALAATNGIPDSRVDTVIDLVGLSDVADRSSGGFSLGMGQRLGIASALLGDPHTVMLDEPLNGLDPEGIRWMRALLRSLADEGRTVFVSSHLMSEMALVADHFVIVGAGRLIADVTANELAAMAPAHTVRVRTPNPTGLHTLLEGDGDGVNVSSIDGDVLIVTGRSSEQIGTSATAAGIILYELTPQPTSLEQTFMDLTHDSVQYRAGGTESAQ
jgi:ABC-2 type transport system ATP-binding protein